MKFQNKILLSIWGVVLSLLVITFFIINYWTRSGIEETFSKELRSSHTNLRVLMALQSEILLRGSQVIAESPRLRAVVELQDAKTAYQLSQEINQTTASDLFLLTDFRGRPFYGGDDFRFLIEKSLLPKPTARPPKHVVRRRKLRAQLRKHQTTGLRMG